MMQGKGEAGAGRDADWVVGWDELHGRMWNAGPEVCKRGAGGRVRWAQGVARIGAPGSLAPLGVNWGERLWTGAGRGGARGSCCGGPGEKLRGPGDGRRGGEAGPRCGAHSCSHSEQVENVLRFWPRASGTLSGEGRPEPRVSVRSTGGSATRDPCSLVGNRPLGLLLRIFGKLWGCRARFGTL